MFNKLVITLKDLCLNLFYPSPDLYSIAHLHFILLCYICNLGALGARGPGLNSRLGQGLVCFVVVVYLLFCPKTHYLLQNCAISVAILIYLV